MAKDKPQKINGALDDFFNPKKLLENRWQTCRLGDLTLYLYRTQDEWLYGSQICDDDTSDDIPFECIAESAAPPQSVTINRCIVGGENASVSIVPIMPDRPVVVKPATKIGIASQTMAVFFLTIPITLKVLAVGGKEVKLAEIPTFDPVGTWFGTFTEGILCYALKSKARRTLDEVESNFNRCVAPVTIINSSNREVEFVSMCVQVDNLALYVGQSHLWSNAIQFEIKGDNSPNELLYSPEPPNYERIIKKLSEPRRAVSKTAFNWELGSFKLIRNV